MQIELTQLRAILRREDSVIDQADVDSLMNVITAEAKPSKAEQVCQKIKALAFHEEGRWTVDKQLGSGFIDEVVSELYDAGFAPSEDDIVYN